MERLLQDEGQTDRLFQDAPGASLWVVQRRIQSNFRIALENPAALLPGEPDRDESSLLGKATEDNLRTLVVRVLQAWKDAPKENPQERTEARDLVIAWMLRLLQRAYQFGPELARGLAWEAQSRIMAWRGKKGDRVEMWVDLGLFAGFLRKWVLRGYTYREKSVQLYQLYQWNRECGRSLDALAYLTRVMRLRVDPQWVAALPERGWSPAVWDVVACPAGDRPLSPFSIASFTDGKISAFSAAGLAIHWRLAEGREEAQLGNAPLELGPNKLRLRHRWARDFLQQYRHGPYARSLLLTPLNGEKPGDGYLLFFCLRGWRSQDQEEKRERKPHLCALWIRPEFTGEEVTELVIEDVVAEPIEEELYGLCELDSPSREAGSHLVLAGTNGTILEDKKDKRRVPCPFLEVEIRRGETGMEIKVRRDLRVSLFPKGQRSLFHQASADMAYNPCWVLTASTGSSGREPYSPTVWCGFQDGSIRGFKRHPFGKEGAPTWVEGGRWVVDEAGKRVFDERPRQMGIKVSAAVWSLLRIERPDDLYLAYGTGDGTLGLLDLKALERDEPEEFCHLLHTREASPVCELMEYHEDGGQRLLAVTQQGVVCIFSLDLSPEVKASDGTTEFSPRFFFLGLRLDHFTLPHKVRALVRVDGKRTEEGPYFLVGSTDGSIHLHYLRYPRKGNRRKALFDRQGDSDDNVPKLLDRLLGLERAGAEMDDSTTPGLAACVGSEDALAWLRVLDLDDLNLVRVSLWRELNDRAPEISSSGALDSKTQDYITDLLLPLADEIYSRQPFSKEPAKVLWEVTARIANRVLERALDFGDEEEKKRRLLAFHRDLALAIDDLCNRWVGFEQSFETKVLIHSFEAFFDWTHIVLLTSSHELKEAASIRSFLLQKTVRRRLHHSNAIVALETLRVLNGAMIRAVWNVRSRGGEGPRWSLHLRPPGDQSVGFYELMTLVGDLGERLSESLVPADPFSTELIRFFALSILLLPDSGLIVGQVVSESRLIERGNGLSRAIERQARAIAGQLGLVDPELEGAIRRFAAYCDTQAELDLILHWPDEAQRTNVETESLSSWRFLLHEALRREQCGDPVPYTDAHYLAELKRIMIIASWLSWLDDEEREAEMRIQNQDSPWSWKNYPQKQILADFRKRPAEWHYFMHSARYLKKLWRVRGDVRKAAGLEKQPRGTLPSIHKAIDRCDLELRTIADADLFQPQRSHYEQIIRGWRESLMQRADKAVRVLDLMDEFNRHVYRISADNLMTSITELALQTAPLSFYEKKTRQAHEGPIRLLILDRLEGHPLVREVFERGDRLVDYTHLSGTLLAVARDYLGKTGELAVMRIEHHVTQEEVLEEIETARVIKGLVLPGLAERKWLLQTGGDLRVPGTRAIWSAIAQEFATNISRYCRGGPDDGAPYLKAAILREQERSCVLISGSFPFVASLPAQRQEELRVASGGREIQASKVEELILTLWNPRVRVHGDDVGASSGMGLHLIWEISDLCGLTTELTLRDPVREQPRNEEEKLRCPLCLKLEWKNL
ncbi:MAG TPA: hypothetical protein VMW27_07735 [Thermoanaerobaculia bacterium]|nr:hypothetical protein [Thermoanaerobaculia bacterium]